MEFIFVHKRKIKDWNQETLRSMAYKILIKKITLLKYKLEKVSSDKYIPIIDNEFLYLLYEFDYNIKNSINDLIKAIKNNKFDKLINNVLNKSLNNNLINSLIIDINILNTNINSIGAWKK